MLLKRNGIKIRYKKTLQAILKQQHFLLIPHSPPVPSFAIEELMNCSCAITVCGRLYNRRVRVF